MEDVEDNFTKIKFDAIIEDFKPPAGEPQPKLANTHSDFECLWDKQALEGRQPWSLSSSIEDWDFACWIMESGLSQRQIESILKLDIVSE